MHRVSANLRPCMGNSAITDNPVIHRNARSPLPKMAFPVIGGQITVISNSLRSSVATNSSPCPAERACPFPAFPGTSFSAATIAPFVFTPNGTISSKKFAEQFGCAEHAYVLMTNPVHLLPTPHRSDRAALLMKHDQFLGPVLDAKLVVYSSCR